jgi:hypothetical protein
VSPPDAGSEGPRAREPLGRRFAAAGSVIFDQRRVETPLIRCRSGLTISNPAVACLLVPRCPVPGEQAANPDPDRLGACRLHVELGDKLNAEGGDSDPSTALWWRVVAATHPPPPRPRTSSDPRPRGKPNEGGHDDPACKPLDHSGAVHRRDCADDRPDHRRPGWPEPDRRSPGRNHHDRG